jgi:D-xylose 1-dehydrogenase (NADP+, D-xylono-1,5-lactone-forming)
MPTPMPEQGGAQGPVERQGQGARIDSVGFGVIGAGSMVAELAILPGLAASARAHLVASCSRSGAASHRGSRHAVASYDDVIDHPEVEVVYVPLPNALHTQWVTRAAAAGKHVLCEKPLAVDAVQAGLMREACDAAGVLLAEAWMTPFDPRWQRTFALVDDGALGAVTDIEANFTFTIAPDAADNYRWSPVLGGGALLDVGIYCLGGAVRLWGADPTNIEVTRVMAPSGVDATTAATLTWPGGRTARIRCSFIEAEQQLLRITGELGELRLEDGAFTGGSSATTIHHVSVDGAGRIIHSEAGDPYVRMLDAFAAAVRGTTAWPRPVEHSAAMIGLLDRVRQIAS